MGTGFTISSRFVLVIVESGDSGTSQWTLAPEILALVSHGIVHGTSFAAAAAEGGVMSGSSITCWLICAMLSLAALSTTGESPAIGTVFSRWMTSR